MSHKRKVHYRMILLLLAMLLVTSNLCVYKVNADEKKLKTVRVGFFAFDGYHNMDEYGNKSGYGYEVLQQMKRHEDWKYEYVGYDRSWNDMLTMLENGEIDMVTSAGKSEERMKAFDYSDYDIGHNSVILTVRADDDRYSPGDHDQYDGMRIGLLYGNEKNEKLDELAAERGFTYIPVFYDNTEELEHALQEGKDIDALLTSNLRRPENEKILEEFDAKGFYVIVKKGNHELMDEINHALIRMSNDDPQWKEKLRIKYYQLGMSNDVTLSNEDTALIRQLNEENKVFTVLARPDNEPYSYLVDGKMCGIIPDLFSSMAAKAHISYEYLPIKTITQYWEAFNGDVADFVLDATSSFQRAENLGMVNVGTYMSTPISAVYRQRNENDLRKVSSVRELSKAVETFNSMPIEFKESATFTQSIEWLQDGTCDIALLPSLRAEEFLLADYRNQYMATVLSDRSISFSILVKQGEYPKLASLLAKICASVNTDDTERLMVKYRSDREHEVSLVTFFYSNPFFCFMVVAVVALSVVCALIITIRRKQELAERNQQLIKTNEFLLENDPLTGGFNGTGFLKEIEKFRKKGHDLSKYTILFVDIKDFKAINEMVGRKRGDELLVLLYNTFNENFKPDISAKVEADHFAFFLSQEKRDFDLLKDTLTLEKDVDGNHLKIHCLCGIYEIEDGEQPVEKMLYFARVARYFLTEDSAEPYKLFEPYMSHAYIDKAEVLTNYENGIKNKEFQVYYQPIVDVKTGKIASAEALVRWKRGDSMISPGLFIPTLEKNGCISELDAYIEQSVYDFLLERKDSGKPVVPISVNLSGIDIKDKAFIDKLSEHSRRERLGAHLMRYELTETAYTDLEDSYISFIQKLKEGGTQFVLDDFGSGYSSFGMIQNYHFGILKIDMSFIRNMMHNDKVKVIVQTIISMCHQLGIKVVAEGVEHREESLLLNDMECDYIQGYYYSKPLCENDFVAYLDEHTQNN